jgi:hypothetical protein
MTFLRIILTLSLATSALGCLQAPEDGQYSNPAAEEAQASDMARDPWMETADEDPWAEEEDVSAGQAPRAGSAVDTLGGSDDVFTTAVRYCNEEFHCNTACDCINGTCQPDGFGPSPPGEYCAQPPQRACSSYSDCRSACACVNGFCQPDGFGPFPPGDYCVQPPPDAYEYDDYHSYASHYPGSPQTGHNFHERGDVDWILVYFGYAMTATFETYNLSGSNTYLVVYSYNYATGQLGAQVGANDDMCGFWWSPSCWASRVMLSVPANSVYAIQVSNTNDGGRSVYDQNAPSYDFRIY